jgi:hypothetical protein
LVGSGYTSQSNHYISNRLNPVVDINGLSSIVDILGQRVIPQSDQNLIPTVIIVLGLYDYLPGTELKIILDVPLTQRVFFYKTEESNSPSVKLQFTAALSRKHCIYSDDLEIQLNINMDGPCLSSGSPNMFFLRYFQPNIQYGRYTLLLWS